MDKKLTVIGQLVCSVAATVYLFFGLLEVRGHLVDLLADNIAQLVPGEITQDALGLVEEDTAGQQALVHAVEEGQTSLTQTRWGY